MRIDRPTPEHLSQLRRLWQEAFGDTDDFLDSFYRTAYSPDRCRCALDGDQVAAVLYWMDCMLEGQKLAYLYAVVTHPRYRGRGLCRQLMENTHGLLRARGYAGAVLVPQKESLRQMYGVMGYENCGGLSLFSCGAGQDPIPLRAVGASEFAALRRKLLPPGAVIQEGEGLAFLSEQLQFYAGEDLLLAAFAEQDTLHVPELLGDPGTASGILKALGAARGNFRTPGTDAPFAMFHPLTEDAIVPSYFGFAFD